MLAVGGDEHLPIAVYYDTPVISLRPIILPTLVEDPSRLKEYFVLTDEGNPDTRHVCPRPTFLHLWLPFPWLMFLLLNIL